jgi:hypothetical protein
MFKAIIYSVLCTVIVCGIAWFVFGRNNTSDLEAALTRTNGSFKVLERNHEQFKSDFDDYIGRVSGSVEKSNRLRDEVGELRDEAGTHISDLGVIKSGLDSIHGRVITVEDTIREGLIVSRDLADLAYWYRRGSEEDAKTK